MQPRLWTLCFALHCAGLVAILGGAEPSLATTLAARTPWTQSQLRGAPDAPPPYRVRPAFPALRFNRPVVLTNAPGLTELFVAEQDGGIYAFQPQRDTKQRELVLQMKDKYPNLEAVYGLTFHPHFQQNREVFVCYVLQGAGPDGSRVSRFRTRTDSLQIDPDSEQILITWLGSGHNGGCIKFGPDGYLYITTGDGASPSPPDPLDAGQDVSNLLSAILRIDVDQVDSGRPYRIPSDNPFVHLPEARGEIYAFGFRNPWKMSFDRQTGDLWVGDVGWEMWEMIDRVQKGGNYGWSIVEGDQPVRPNDTPGPAPILPPTIKHSHAEAASITGGFVYRGQRLPDLAGVYVYGDYQSGVMWGARMEDDRVAWHHELAHTPLQLVGFCEDNAGELYLLDYRDQIYELVVNEEPDTSQAFPHRLSETGLFTSTTDLTPAPGVMPYRINAQSWADNSQSQRWIALPGNDPLQRNRNGRWRYPDGTVLAKQISIEMKAGDPSSLRHLETQVLLLEGERWRPYTYVWNESQADAELVGAAGTELALEIEDANAPGGRRQQSWRVHGRKECIICHNPWVEKATANFGIQSASPLAMSIEQLDTNAFVNGARQLQQWRELGWLQSSTADAENPLVDPYDERADLNLRARSYLAVNCAHCHQFNAGGTATILLSYEMTNDRMNLIDVSPTQGAFGIADAKLVASGDPTRSVLFYRVSKTGGGRMPRIGSREVDRRGAKLLRDWITSLGDGPQPPAATFAWAQAAEPANSVTLHDSIASVTANTRGALELLAVLEDDRTTATARAAIIEQCGRHETPEVRDLFESFLPADQRAKRLGAVVDMEAILKLPADAPRGQQLFASNRVNCKNCHRIGDLGTAVGPPLDQIGKKYDARQLLQHILEPSRFIEPQYVPYVLETHDGQILTGILSQQNDTSVTLQDATSRLHQIGRDNIASLNRQTVSLMPELLLSELTAEQVADLVEYLRTRN
ncbi:MAG: PQQ-dependent sugar dehydrogenase [Planctomycetales bacterium]|nr:PQQ-dependent sugar dehydrogenase [Planctomycetales bacterium]